MTVKENDGATQNNKDELAKATPFFHSVRFVLAILGCLMFIHLYAQRVGMSVAIVCMVNQTAVGELSRQTSGGDSNSSTDDVMQRTPSNPQCTRTVTGKNETAPLLDGPFVWEKSIQGHILGSFFYGYMISQIPGGLLAEQFGGKWVLFGFLGLSSVATLLTPIAARLSFGLLIVLRVLVGIGSGALFPAMHAMWGKWAPPLERSKLTSITYAGCMMGNVIALPLSGVLCQYGFAGGWGSVFYVIGISSVLCLVLWAIFASDTPDTNKFISKAERNYIVQSLKSDISERTPKLSEVPWLKFLRSGPVWALIISNFCVDWGFYTLLTNIPTFYSEVLLFDITSNGLYSALPFIGLWANMNVVPIFADYLQAKKILSTGVTRKLFNSIGLFMGTIFLVALSFLDCTQTMLAVALLTLAVSSGGFVFSGFFINHMDIAPVYAGTLMGISNGVAAVSGFIAPTIAAIMTTSQTREDWQKVFFISAAVQVFGAVMYILLGSGELQPWARGQAQKSMELDIKDSPPADESNSKESAKDADAAA